jgi:hypothetical protein
LLITILRRLDRRRLDTFTQTRRATTVEDRLTVRDGGRLRLVFDADPWISLIASEPGIPV